MNVFLLPSFCLSLALHQSSTKRSVYPSPIPIAFRQGPYCSSICSFWLCAHFFLPPTPHPLFFLGGGGGANSKFKKKKQHCAPPLQFPVLMPSLLCSSDSMDLQFCKQRQYPDTQPISLPFFLCTLTTPTRTQDLKGGGGGWRACRTISCI